MDNYLLERMVEHKQSELNRARGRGLARHPAQGSLTPIPNHSSASSNWSRSLFRDPRRSAVAGEFAPERSSLSACRVTLIKRQREGRPFC